MQPALHSPGLIEASMSGFVFQSDVEIAFVTRTIAGDRLVFLVIGLDQNSLATGREILMTVDRVDDQPALREPREGDRTWVSHRPTADGPVSGHWLVYSAETGTWHSDA
ncbi:hypothetical protein ASF98_13135 [Arthrobacter sp. Leaf337]|nr:hypothetical protein ASF98_13135 [Arthrobacter sp. Leaf337]